MRSTLCIRASGARPVIAVAILINALANAFLALQGSVPPAVACTAFFGSSMILLFVILLLLPQDRLRGATVLAAVEQGALVGKERQADRRPGRCRA